MDEKWKKWVSLGLATTLSAATIVPVNVCGQMQICAIENAEAPHTHQERPAPGNTGRLAVMTVATTSGVDSYTVVIRDGEILIT